MQKGLMGNLALTIGFAGILACSHSLDGIGATSSVVEPVTQNFAVQVVLLDIEGRVTQTLCFAGDLDKRINTLQPKGISPAYRVVLRTGEHIMHLTQPACIRNTMYQPGICQEGAYILPRDTDDTNTYTTGSIGIGYTDSDGNKVSINPTGGITQYNFQTWEQGKKTFIDKCTIRESEAKGKKK